MEDKLAEKKVIEGVQVVYAPTRGIRRLDDDTSYPYKLYLNLRPPSLMEVTFAFIYGGSEEFLFRGKTREALEELIEVNTWKTHCRLRRLVLTHPDGKQELIAGKEGPSL